MALRLRGSTSGYAEIDAPAVAGDVTLTLPSTTGTINVKDASGTTNVGTGVNLGNPSANIFTISNTGGERLRIAADGSVSIPGNLDISGVLTYEDVTSVDAIGLSTFRDGLNTKDVGLNAISSSITDTAVDVFIYDTSKDSDGGEWRKRTSHTSWYNETLETATRGSRREFPSVAVIVAESNQVTIYDGDDPDLPMWMKFERDSSGSNKFLTANRTNTAVTAVNGIIAWCDTVDAQILKFIEDAMYLYGTGGIYSPNTYIANRNNTNAVNFSVIDSSVLILDAACNDIAMTVLPNAPIDDATGLPIPTIAVATDGGVSVIKDDGFVVDLIQNHAEANKVKHIDFDSKTNAILWTTDYVTGGSSTADSYKLNVNPILSTDYTSGGAVVGTFQNWNRVVQALSNLTKPHIQGDNITEFISNGGNGSYAVSSNGTNQCLNLLYEFPGSTVGSTSELNAMVAYVTTSYNSGWMYRDIKGAFLSDTTVESLTANTNLASSATQTATARLTSETYTDGATSWQMVDNAGNDNGYLAIIFGGLTVGQSYHLSMTVDANAALDAGYEHKIEQGSSIVYLNHWNGTGAATLTANFTAASGTNALYFYANGITVNVTNFNIRAVDDEDRSVNNNGLAVYGTITKSAVATGADLVAYSGWSTSNNLVQPYNSGLNFGTGDFSIIAWIKKPTLTTNHYILDRNDGSTENGRFAFMVNASGALNLYFGTTSDQCNSGNSVFVGSSAWRMVMVKRISGVVTFGLDGKEYASTTTSGNWSTANLTGSGDENLFIGQYGGGAPGSLIYNADYGIGEIALLRISASAPSAEQVKKMYEDEKVLFQENAKATLYGSSDAVTALAFDEVTDQLHVGTSGGRSDFQGLRRINNTTTAVTTAISAHDSFILEQ